MAKILIVEDDEMLALSIQTALESHGHVVQHVKDGTDALILLTGFNYELVILDWGLPGLSGLEILEKYRARNGCSSILMLTGKNDIQDKEAGFLAGSDDYLTKPFDLRELEARVIALLRRSHAYEDEILTNGNVQINIRTRVATLSGIELALTTSEFAVLEFLLKRPDQFFTVNDLLSSVWNSDSEATEHAVRQCISRLRKKLTEPEKSSIIRTSKGLGYRVDSADAFKQ